jgi:hypothetical protein
MRTEKDVMHLSPLEACCVCGGGKRLGFSLGAKRTVATLWPLVLAAASSSESKVARHATRIVMVGKAGLLDAVREFDEARLTEVATMLATVRTGEVVAGILAIPGPLKQLLQQLIDEPRIKRVGKGLGKQPLPGLTRNALNLDMEDAAEQFSNQSEMDRYAWWAYMQPTIVCALHTLNFIIMMIGLYLCAQWFIDQRYHMDRLYVVLKLHRDYFGPAKERHLWQPFVQNRHKVEQLMGFYLPPANVSPYRLREMSNALLSPCDEAPTQQQQPAAISRSQTQASSKPVVSSKTGGAKTTTVAFQTDEDSD